MTDEDTPTPQWVHKMHQTKARLFLIEIDKALEEFESTEEIRG